jgi:hypothetical protein
MEAAIDAGQTGKRPDPSAARARTVRWRPNAPDSYVVKRGDTLWGIAKVFLRDPWYWPEIWQVNPQIQNPHLIYPGDTLRLVYINGQPRILLQRGDEARVEPRVRSQPLEAAITTIPTTASRHSCPSPRCCPRSRSLRGLRARSSTNTRPSPKATRFTRAASASRRGRHALQRRARRRRAARSGRQSAARLQRHLPGTGRVTRTGDPATLIMTESNRETEPGDKVFPGGVDVPLDFIPEPAALKVNGRIMASPTASP